MKITRSSNPVEGYDGSGFFEIWQTFDETSVWLWTNAHVVGNDETVEVYWHLADKTVEAEVWYKDDELDVAILVVEFDEFEQKLPDVTLGVWYGGDDYEKGDKVYAAGYPDTTDAAQKAPVITDGAVYSNTLNRGKFIEHSAEIRPGNSGGPLMDKHGNVIGINTSYYPSADRIGLALPMETALAWIAELVTPEPVRSRLEQSDGAYWAVPYWYEDGETIYLGDDEGGYCVVMYRPGGSDPFPKDWNCDFSGFWYEGYVYFEYGGVYYNAPAIGPY